MNELEKLEKIIGYKFKNKSILEKSLCHISYANFVGKPAESNERLEFLGDTVLNMIVSDILFKKHPDVDEGKLTRLRASLVNSKATSRYAKRIGLDKFILFAPQENEINVNPDIYSDFFEALIGAIYLDGGIESCIRFIKRIVDFTEATDTLDYKTKLQEFVQKEYGILPKYEVKNTKGPEHNKTFYVVVKVKGRIKGHGEGKSKKEAEQNAAKQALELIKVKKDKSNKN